MLLHLFLMLKQHIGVGVQDLKQHIFILFICGLYNDDVSSCSS
jgi:hypothetical protein